MNHWGDVLVAVATLQRWCFSSTWAYGWMKEDLDTRAGTEILHTWTAFYSKSRRWWMKRNVGFLIGWADCPGDKCCDTRHPMARRKKSPWLGWRQMARGGTWRKCPCMTRIDLSMDGLELKWCGVEPYSFRDRGLILDWQWLTNTGTASGNKWSIVSMGAWNAWIIVTKGSSKDSQHGFSTQETSPWLSRLSHFTRDQLVLADCPSCCGNYTCYCIHCVYSSV